jgi:hypothetical protein
MDAGNRTLVLRLLKRTFKVLAGLLVFGVSGIGLLLGLLWFEHRVETNLPLPTGSFAVGRTTYIWIDDAQDDPLAPVPGIKRELIVWIWYPSLHQSSASRAEDYLPAPWRTAVAQYRGGLISGLLDRDYALVRTHSLRDAQISPRLPLYPIVIMRAGLAALTTEYTALA